MPEQSIMKRMMDDHERMMATHRAMWNSWGFNDSFSEPFARSLALTPSLIASNNNAILTRSSPHYEITEDDKKFQIAVDVPGVKKNDMTVQLEHGGRVLKLAGHRNVKKGNSVSETKFEQCLSISSNVDVSKLTANLADGVLIVTAPKKEPVAEDVKMVEITEKPH